MADLNLTEFKGFKISDVLVEVNKCFDIKFIFRNGSNFEVYGATKLKTETWTFENDKEHGCMYCTDESDKEPIAKEIGIEMYINSDSPDGIAYIQEEHSQTTINISYCPKCGRKLSYKE